MKTTINYTNINCPICKAPQADLEALTAHLVLTHEIADPKSSTTTPNSNHSILSVATRRHRRQLRRTATKLDALAQEVLMASHLATLDNPTTCPDCTNQNHEADLLHRIQTSSDAQEIIELALEAHLLDSDTYAAYTDLSVPALQALLP